LAALPESRETLVLELTSRIALLEIGRIAGIEAREPQGLFEEARAVAERLGDPRGHAFLLTSYGRLCGLAGDVAQYLACAERAAELAEGSDDAALAFEMHTVLAHAELAEERGSPFSRVEAAAFLGAAELTAGDVATATSTLETALALARARRAALWYEPRILATLADAKRAAGDRSGARVLLDEARECVERGLGWRLSACDVELARVRLLASEPVPDRTAIESALESVEALATEL